RSRTAISSSTTGRSSRCKAVPPVTDEQNHSSNLPGTGDRPEVLAQPGSPGRHGGVSPVGGARIPGGRQRTDRPGDAAAFREDHVRVVFAGGFWSERLSPAGGKDSAVRQGARKLHSRRPGILRDRHAHARDRRSTGGQIE